MNILFVHEVDWLAKVVFDIHFLSEALSLRGHRIYVIDYEDTWHRNGFFDLGSLRTKQIDNISRALPEASVCIRRPGFIKIPGLTRISAAFTTYLEIKRAIREKKIDAIMLYSVPTSGLQSIHLAQKFNIPVIFRSIDMLSILVPYPWLRPATRILEKKVYARVDLVLPATPQYLKYVTGMGAAQTKTKLLLFPVDTGLFHPSVDCSEVRQQWGFSESDQIIVFIGTLFNFSGLDAFIQEFPRVVREVPEAKLLIVGDGPQRPKLERIIIELGLARQVTITGFQPYKTMPQYINLANICINTFVISESTMDIFPAKMMQYIACGKATVATALHGIMTLLPGESHGVVYANSATEMADGVISLMKSAERRHQLENAGLDYIKQKHNYEIISRQLETILEEAIKEKHNGTKHK